MSRSSRSSTRATAAAGPAPGDSTLSLEGVLVGSLGARLVDANEIALDQFLQVLVERLHADLRAGLDRRIHLRDLVLADQVADRRRADHDLVRRHAAGTILGLEQR